MKNFILPFLFVFILLNVSNITFAQNSTMDEVRLFQSFFRDTPVYTQAHGGGIVDYQDFELANTLRYGGQAAYAVTNEIEVAAGFYYIKFDRDEIENSSGITDIPVFVRYNFVNDRTKFSAGAYATIPVGDESVGQDNTDLGIFGAVRHPATEKITLTGTLGIDFLETGIDREASLYLGTGIIFAANEQLSILGELAVQSDLDYSAISVGGDYKIVDAVRLRGNLLLGLDDTAPDFGLTGGFIVIL